MSYIAHKTEDGRSQTLYEHLNNVAKLCRENAVDDFKDYAELCGKLHDLGKYTQSFQKRINGSNVRVQHARYGAQELSLHSKNFYIPMLQYCIAGHHSGLPDGGSVGDDVDKSTLNGILKRDTEDYSYFKNEVFISYPNDKIPKLMKLCKSEKEIIELYSFFTRYIYSCLTDADYIDTELFFEPKSDRDIQGDFLQAYERVCSKMTEFVNTTAIQKARGKLQNQVFESIGRESEIYTINMPTGSGKTLCSIRAALKVAIDKKKKRIIYVIPFTSIIEQTAEIFDDIFGDVLPVLQHHSNFDFEDYVSNISEENFENITTLQKLKRACENWNAPLIVTTNIQFFESLYHHKSSRLRKMHNLADSIIVFDEIHMLPIDYIQPCLRAIGYITKYLNSTALLMSATMPDYSDFLKKYMPANTVLDAVQNKELFRIFEKCEYNYLAKCAFDNIAERANRYQSSLIVVNTRKTAKEMYGVCKNVYSGNIYHLSTYMTPKHRSDIIRNIKTDLINGIKTIVVSTSLIEAGVDLDFEAVFRENSGLDNVIQSAGRCNREGKRRIGHVYVFETDGGYGDIQLKANITRSLFKEYTSISSQQCVKEYYGRLFESGREQVENNTITSLMGNSFKLNEIPFRTYSENFKFIDNRTIAIVIPDDFNTDIIEELKYGSIAAKRKLQKYTSSVYFWEFEEMLKLGIIEQIDDGVYILSNDDYYDDELGLDIDKEINYIV